MKNSETDRELSDLIKGTLDKYEEQYILGSWENFVRSRKRRKNLILWFALSGVAASLLLGWLGFRFILPDYIFSNEDWQQKNTSNLETSLEKDTLKGLKIVRPFSTIPEQNMKTKVRIDEMTLQSSGKSYNSDDSYNKNKIQKEIRDSLNILRTSEFRTSGSISENYLSGKIADIYDQDTINMGMLSQSGSGIRVSSVSEVNGSDTAVNKADQIKADIKMTPADDLSDNRRSQKFRFGVNISPGVTSTSTASSFNYSGGINADYELSRSFRLSSGIQVEHQNVTNERSDNPAWLPSGQTQADLVDIDLPLNLTWKFLIRKSACYYLSGGISSVIYLSENYTSTSYTLKMVGSVNMNDGEPNVTYELENVKSVEQETEAPLSTFDFAGRINIIFGFEQHLSTRVFLHFEPYLKIPVSELATQNLKYTTSGITCKISF
jgi:hypothetical protein